MEKKEIKIKLSTAIVLTLAFIVVLVLVILGVYYKVNKDKDNNIVEIPTVTEPIQGNSLPAELPNATEPTQEKLLTDLDMSFLKMENEKKNMLYSPLSIKYALKMLDEGAAGNTKEQIEKVVGKYNLTKYENVEDILSFANALYIRDTYSKDIKEDYKTLLANKYNAEVKYDPFADAKNVNNWIENKTLGIIKNMLEDEEVQDPDVVALLINALAIDMEWENPFDAKDTHGKDFNLVNNTTLETTTMHELTSSEDVSYYKDKNITSFTKDLKRYGDTQLEFTAIMPESNLSEYINTLTTDEIDKIIKESKPASETKAGVSLSVPRFSFDYDLKLKKDLKRLGITDAFGSSANFANMSVYNDIHVSKALHKADIDFTEKGIKAAASTVIMFSKNLAPSSDKAVIVCINKPFIFVIRDKKTGEIWFLGTVYEPNAWKNDKANYEYR